MFQQLLIEFTLGVRVLIAICRVVRACARTLTHYHTRYLRNFRRTCPSHWRDLAGLWPHVSYMRVYSRPIVRSPFLFGRVSGAATVAKPIGRFFVLNDEWSNAIDTAATHTHKHTNTQEHSSTTVHSGRICTPENTVIGINFRVGQFLPGLMRGRVKCRLCV